MAEDVERLVAAKPGRPAVVAVEAERLDRSAQLLRPAVWSRFRIQRKRQRGTNRRRVYTYPSRKALASIKTKVRTLTRRSWHHDLATLLRRLNPVLRGWCTYFRHGVSKRTFGYLDAFAWKRIVGWLRKRHPGLSWGTLRRRYLPDWEISDDGVDMFRPRAMPVTRYRYRHAHIPTPWASTP